MTRRNLAFPIVAIGVTIMLCAGGSALASSHREAPFITKLPKVDATDFYMFRSYEAGREDFVTLLANYVPLQDPYGGPNYFFLDPEAMYEIHIDNNGDAVEDITFQFRPQIDFQALAVPVGPVDNQRTNTVPVYNIGQIDEVDDADLNIREDYTLTVVRGPRRTGTASAVPNGGAGNTFSKPADYVGTKSFPDYPAYAQQHMYDINVPGCATTGGRVFVGQRDDPFVVALGELFDLINLPAADVTGQNAGCQDAQNDDLLGKNVTTFALEVPIACLTSDAAGTDPVIGGWTTASVRQGRVINPTPNTFGDAAIYGGPWAQVSRLGNPLVNEVVVGLGDKNFFNASEPTDDAYFLDYVTHPVFPELVEIIFADAAPLAPNVFPREDLVSVFLTGVAGVNQPATVTPSEQLRLNTSIAVTAAASQNTLGVIGGDNAGFPNGRRPADDVVDIALRAMMGVLLPEDATTNPAGSLAFTDCTPTQTAEYPDVFPYLATPVPGSADL